MGHPASTTETLTLLIATLDALGCPVAISPSTREAAKGRAVTIWEQDGFTYVKACERPADGA